MKEEISNKFKKIISILSIMSLLAFLLIIPAASDESTDPVITIYDNDELLTIPVNEVQLACGDTSCVAAAFRATQTAFCEWNGIPVRGKTEIISAQPSNGSIGTFEYILGSSDYVTVDLPQGTSIVNLSPENFHYQFIDTSTDDIVVIDIKESTFPDGFFELRKKCKENTATPEEKAEFKLMKSELKNNLLNLPVDELFNIMASNWRDKWMGENSDGGTAVTTTELKDAIHHWLEDIPVNGHTLNTENLQEVIAAWINA
ncbi:MAG: hypothetical protein K8R25_05865 [Methanosarcinales archaeon]|nr:hypothetical protein [Methanosarcinales archaeon]